MERNCPHLVPSFPLKSSPLNSAAGMSAAVWVSTEDCSGPQNHALYASTSAHGSGPPRKTSCLLCDACQADTPTWPVTRHLSAVSRGYCSRSSSFSCCPCLQACAHDMVSMQRSSRWENDWGMYHVWTCGLSNRLKGCKQ